MQVKAAYLANLGGRNLGARNYVALDKVTFASGIMRTGPPPGAPAPTTACISGDRRPLMSLATFATSDVDHAVSMT